jgi:hypothetical protein
VISLIEETKMKFYTKGHVPINSALPRVKFASPTSSEWVLLRKRSEGENTCEGENDEEENRERKMAKGKTATRGSVSRAMGKIK